MNPITQHIINAEQEGFHLLDDLTTYVNRFMVASRHEVYLACRELDTQRPSLTDTIIAKLTKEMQT